jgi:cysteine sulfinate desulfinase/cysteine desulfurase-like protein
MTAPIYVEHKASTPVDPRVVGVMIAFLTSDVGNPTASSSP